MYLVSDVIENSLPSKVRVRPIHGPAHSFESGFLGWLNAFVISATLVSLKTLRVYLRDGPFDIIHFHDILSGTFILALRRIGVIKAPIVCTLHGYVIDSSTIRYGGIRRIVMLMAGFVMELAARSSDRVLVYSEKQKRSLSSSYRVSEKKIRIISQAVDEALPMRRQSSYRRAEPSQVKSNFILYVGRLSRLKGVQVLLAALAGLKYDCVLVGGGPEREEFAKMAEDIGIADQVSFVGEIPFEDVTEFYRSATIFVLPTLAEGFPLVILEAMTFSLPIISTDVSGIPEVVKEGYNGFIVHAEDVLALRERIRKLMESEKLRKQFGKNSRKIIDERFGIEHLAVQTMAVYEEALGRK